MNKTSKKILGYTLGAVGALLIAEPAMAAPLKAALGTMQDQFQSMADLITGGAYIGGAAFAVNGAMKLRDHSENPSQTPLKKPFILFTVATLLAALPSILTTGTDSVGFSEKNSLQKGVLK